MKRIGMLHEHKTFLFGIVADSGAANFIHRPSKVGNPCCPSDNLLKSVMFQLANSSSFLVAGTSKCCLTLLLLFFPLDPPPSKKFAHSLLRQRLSSKYAEEEEKKWGSGGGSEKGARDLSHPII